MIDLTAPINLGDQATDTVTGFAGIVTGEVRYLTGCEQVLLAPTVAPDGDHRESQWFDTDRVQVTAAGVVQLPARTAAGPDRAAPRRAGHHSVGAR